VNFTALPYTFNYHYTGLYPSLNNQIILISVLNQLLGKKITPFLFSTQSKNTKLSVLKSASLSYIRSLSKITVNQVSSTTNLNFNQYTYHNQFLNYKKYFNSLGVPLFSPFIKKKLSSFSLISKTFTRKILKTQRLKKKIFKHRKF